MEEASVKSMIFLFTVYTYSISIYTVVHIYIYSNNNLRNKTLGLIRKEFLLFWKHYKCQMNGLHIAFLLFTKHWALTE